MARPLALLSRLLAAFWMVILCVALLVVVAALGTRFVDRQLVVIRGGSMESAIPAGSIAIVHPTQPAAIATGDAVTIRTETNLLYTHRVTERIGTDQGWLFRTKGDANPTPDPVLVPATAVVGVVELHIPLVGRLLTLLSAPIGVLALLSLLGTIFLGERLVDDLRRDLETRRRPELQPG